MEAYELLDLAVERRLLIRGWKGDKEFTSSQAFATDESFAREVARIGEPDLPDWQPHITCVMMEERVVSHWKVTRTTVHPDGVRAGMKDED